MHENKIIALLKRSDYENGTFAVFFFPREWRHCLFHTFSLKMSFCLINGTSCVAEWLKRLMAYQLTRIQLPVEVRLRTLEDYIEKTDIGRISVNQSFFASKPFITVRVRAAMPVRGDSNSL